MTQDHRARVKEIAERHNSTYDHDSPSDPWELLKAAHQDRAELLSIVEGMTKEIAFLKGDHAIWLCEVGSLREKLQSSRNDVLEDCAVLSESFNSHGKYIAASIRKLKSTPPERATPRNTKDST